MTRLKESLCISQLRAQSFASTDQAAHQSPPHEDGEIISIPQIMTTIAYCSLHDAQGILLELGYN